MAESRVSWYAKTFGLMILAAVATSLLTTAIQRLVWDTSNPGISGGAAAAIAVAVGMSRRRSLPPEPSNG